MLCPNGRSEYNDWPSLAGQKEAYLLQQLRAFKSGERSHPMMQPVVDVLNDDVVPRQAPRSISHHVCAPDQSGRPFDTENRTIWAGPRVLSEPLNRLLYEKGLAFPSAHTGFVTIGGISLAAVWVGVCLLGVWHVPLAAEVMLADGSVVMASENENTYFYTLDQLDTAVPEFLKLQPESNNRSEVLGALGRFNPPRTPPEKETWHWSPTTLRPC